MTGDPLRLLDDPTTGAALRHDLDVAARPDVGGPVAYDVDAGLARFESTLASNLARGTGTASGGLSSGLAVGALVLAGGLAAVLGWQLAGPTPSAADPSRIAHAGSSAVVSPVSPPRTIAREVAPQPVTPPVSPMPVVTDEVVAEVPAVAEVTPARPPRARKPANQGVRTGAGAADYLREARELNAARALLGKDPAQALTLAEAGAAEFRAGTFVPEWEGVAVLALFELGRRDVARTRGEAYLRRHPSGTYAPRIRQAIDGGS